METYRLVPHPDAPPRKVEAVTVQLVRDGDRLEARYEVSGAQLLSVPGRTEPARADELWKTTCFEMFLKPAGAESYTEFNLSPSSRWAVYGFTGYRAGMMNLPVRADPAIDLNVTQDRLELSAVLDLHGLIDEPARMSLSAVIEEVDGAISYWAIAHPAGAFDFHHDACFVAELPAAA